MRFKWPWRRKKEEEAAQTKAKSDIEFWKTINDANQYAVARMRSNMEEAKYNNSEPYNPSLDPLIYPKTNESDQSEYHIPDHCHPHDTHCHGSHE